MSDDIEFQLVERIKSSLCFALILLNEILATKQMSPELHEAIIIAVKTVNMHSTQGVLQLCVNDLMMIICSSCTTVK